MDTDCDNATKYRHKAIYNYSLDVVALHQLYIVKVRE